MRYITTTTMLFALSCYMMCASAQPPDGLPSQPSAASGLRTVSSIIGSRVQVSGTAYGTVADVVLNDSGCLEYVVVTNGDAYYVAPWGLTQYDGGAHVLTIPTQISTLEQTRWSRSDWPSVSYGVLNERVGRAWPNGRTHNVEPGPRTITPHGHHDTPPLSPQGQPAVPHSFHGKRGLPAPTPNPAP